MNFKNASKNCSSISLFLILTLLLLSTSVTAQTIVSVSPEKIRVEENTNLTMDIIITPDAAISGAEFQLEYDPELVAITKISEGTFLKQGDESTLFSKGSIDSENGTVTNLYGVIIGKEMILEPATFAIIELEARNKAGISEITLKNVIVTNSTGASLPIEVNNGKLLVGDVEEEITDSSTEAQDQSKSAGQNSMIISVFAIMCLSFLFMRK